jgi:hypothetical protein
LEREFGIESKCWVDAEVGTLPKNNKTAETDTALVQRRPNDIPFPIMITSMPKSGTEEAEQYFKCGLGPRAVAQHYIQKSLRFEGDISIGECIKSNMDKGKPLFAGCGESTTKVYSDVGVIRRKGSNLKKPICFYPTLQGPGGLDAFAKTYPRGTLLHVVTDNPRDWYKV